VSDAAAVANPRRRDQVVIAICVAIVTALAWAYLVRAQRQMSAAMHYEVAMRAMGMRMPWQAPDVWFTFQMWVVMMIGMMSASAAPVLFLFNGAATVRRARGVPASVLAFGAGYLAVWTGFSAAATLAQWGLHDAALLSESMRASNAAVGGAILIVAGLYQLTPLKAACLSHCRTPLGFLLSSWRSGVGGAFRMGAHHGLYCLGCCWALMGVLFAVGVMNLLWVAVLAVVVLLEKIGPAGTILARAGGAGLVVAGVASVVIR
jgi:predicted metal-binding membrane protein